MFLLSQAYFSVKKKTIGHSSQKKNKVFPKVKGPLEPVYVLSLFL